jgi:demethylsterigmatocystin 6-O-methyltransferase
MEAPMNQIRELYAQANASERHRLQDQIRDLQNELYTEWDIMFGLAMGVNLHLISLSRHSS